MLKIANAVSTISNNLKVLLRWAKPSRWWTIWNIHWINDWKTNEKRIERMQKYEKWKSTSKAKRLDSQCWNMKMMIYDCTQRNTIIKSSAWILLHYLRCDKRIGSRQQRFSINIQQTIELQKPGFDTQVLFVPT